MSAPPAELTVDALRRRDLRGVVRVVGGPGTGKSTVLADTAVAHMRAGQAPESVLLLTGSARLSSRVRAEISTRMLAAGPRGAVREPLVRTVHSYAFAVLRLAAARNGSPPPRLITGAEQDGIIRELLAGDAEDGDASPVRWPGALRAALTTVGFATELRDLLARCSERGVDPLALQRLGRQAGRPEWQAAGRFAQAYEQVMLLRSAVGMAAPQATVPALGAAELVGAALEALATDPELLAAERARVSLLLVDDAQHLDPQAARLVQVLAAGADLTVIAGDPQQTVFSYRGADPVLLRGEGPRLTLTRSYRCAAPVARAVAAVAARLPGHDGQDLEGTDAVGSVTVRLAASPHAESALVVDALRRAHLVGGVPWSDMAVIVRSIPRVGAALARSLVTAGVPVDLPDSSAALAEQPAARALLTVLAAVADGLDEDRALDLLTGPLGRVDPVSLRALRRALRRGAPAGATDLLVPALERGAVPQYDAQGRAVRRVRAVLAAARRSHDAGHDPRQTLWQAWSRSGLQRRWLAASERGGPAGAQADRDLDAVTALFDVAEDYVGRTAGATLRGLLDHVAALTLPPARTETGREPEAVAIRSAHAALDGEWHTVVVAGVQEGLWPNVAPRGGVLRTQQLVDVMDGVVEVGQRLPGRAATLAEERRLLVAALGRARSHVLVTAVDSDGGDDALLPSPFCQEVAAVATDAGEAAPEPVRAPRVLTSAAVVGRLRALVCAPDGDVDDVDRACAATQLLRLAEAGVPGADPASWYSARPLSCEEPLWAGDDHVVTLSPSSLQMLSDCPLRWLLERHGGSRAGDVRSALGSLVHAVVADSAMSETRLVAELEKIWPDLPFDAAWYADNERDRHLEMLRTFLRWREQTRRDLTEKGTEIEVDGVVVEPSDDGPGVRVRGRIDRVERDSQGRIVVVDVKTGKSPVTKDDAQSHAQLAMYQLAIAAGLLADGDQPGGGRLVYLGRTSGGAAVERCQDAMTDDGLAQWRTTVEAVAAATQGPAFTARLNDGCAHCPVRPMCPAQNTGRTE